MKQCLRKQARWTERWSRVWLLLAMLAVVPNLRGQAPRFSITSEQVVAAMRGHAWSIEGVQVTLPTAITTAVADPKLGIETASMLTTHQARLRVVCRVPAACLPFFATAVWPDSVVAVSPPSDRNGEAASLRPSIQLLPDVGESSAARLRAGASVTLLLEGERVHIQMQVVCLKGGAAGEKVRVATRDRKQTYVAEIVNSTLLKGSLPQ